MLQQNRQAVWQIYGLHSGRSHWTLLWQQFGSDFTALLCCVVTERYSNKLVTNASYQFATQVIKQKNNPYCCYCRSVKQVPLKRPYVSTDITVSAGRRQQSALQQFGFIIKAPVTVISITVPCITVCSGSGTSKETVSAICWCAVKMWIRIAVTKTVGWFVCYLTL
jgi:hypothetical protein